MENLACSVCSKGSWNEDKKKNSVDKICPEVKVWHHKNLVGFLCSYPASRGFFLENLLACTKSLTSLVFHVVTATLYMLNDLSERNL